MCNPSNNMDFAVSIVLGIGVVNTIFQFYGGDQI